MGLLERRGLEPVGIARRRVQHAPCQRLIQGSASVRAANKGGTRKGGEKERRRASDDQRRRRTVCGLGRVLHHPLHEAAAVHRLAAAWKVAARGGIRKVRPSAGLQSSGGCRAATGCRAAAGCRAAVAAGRGFCGLRSRSTATWRSPGLAKGLVANLQTDEAALRARRHRRRARAI